MKRIVMFVMSTLTAVVLLLGYHTSTSSKAAGGETSFVASLSTGTVESSVQTAAAAAVAAPTSGASTSSSAASRAAKSGSTAGAPATAAAAPTSSAQTTAAPTTAAPTTTAAKAASTAAAAPTTVTGDVADTQWGPVQVQLTVQSGKITSVAVVQYPNNNGRDQEINATALPILVQETLTAQNAKIDMVSGATVTSGGYLSSLQSALDKAGL